MYQIIPRKYRPQLFKHIVGQDAIVATLKNALQHQRLAQAYLFAGTKGTGKTTLARLFAKALNCSRLTEELEPCNECASCVEISSGHSLNVIEIDGASNRGIDDVRQINETVGYAPASGNYKIYIIDEVHMLTKEAFNALLKTLEEPPKHVKFFFATTEPHKILPTIISRCQRFDLNRISANAMREKLLRIAADLKTEIAPEALEILIRIAEGSLRDAESLLDRIICYAQGPVTAEIISSTLGITPAEHFSSLEKAIAEHKLLFAYELADEIFSSGRDLGAFMDKLIDHFRSMLKLLVQDPMARPPFTSEQCLYIIEFLISWSDKLTKTSFKQAALEIILLHLIRTSKRVSIDTLVHRLVQLENSLPAKAETVPEQPKPDRPIPPPQPAPPPPPPAPPTKAETVPEQPKPDRPIPPPQPAPSPPPPPAPPTKAADQKRYDTLVRFAAVELEGIVER